jgi:hypothetical protein
LQWKKENIREKLDNKKTLKEMESIKITIKCNEKTKHMNKKK